MQLKDLVSEYRIDTGPKPVAVLIDIETPLLAADAVNALQLNSGDAVLTYAASMTPDLALGNIQTITITDGVAFAIQNPTHKPPSGKGSLFILILHNTSGGAAGAVTWGPNYHLAGPVTAPADTKYFVVAFVMDGTSGLLIEAFRSTGDIA